MIMQGYILYTPQTFKIKNNLIKKIECHGDGNLILMGDYNAVMNEILVKSRRGISQSLFTIIFRK